MMPRAPRLKTTRRGRRAHLQEELGDVFYPMVFLTLLAERQGWFDLRMVLRQTRRKMIRRHPHVFGGTRVATAAEAYTHWQAVKRREKRGNSPPRALRALLLALWDALLPRCDKLTDWRGGLEALQARKEAA